MEHLNTKTVKVGKTEYKVSELSYRHFKEVVGDEENGQLLAIKYGCEGFGDKSLEEISDLPTRVVVRISKEIADISAPEDPEGN